MVNESRRFGRRNVAGVGRNVRSGASGSGPRPGALNAPISRAQFVRTAGIGAAGVAAAGLGLGGVARAQTIPAEGNVIEPAINPDGSQRWVLAVTGTFTPADAQTFGGTCIWYWPQAGLAVVDSRNSNFPVAAEASGKVVYAIPDLKLPKPAGVKEVINPDIKGLMSSASERVNSMNRRTGSVATLPAYPLYYDIDVLNLQWPMYAVGAAYPEQEPFTGLGLWLPKWQLCEKDGEMVSSWDPYTDLANGVIDYVYDGKGVTIGFVDTGMPAAWFKQVEGRWEPVSVFELSIPNIIDAIRLHPNLDWYVPGDGGVVPVFQAVEEYIAYYNAVSDPTDPGHRELARLPNPSTITWVPKALFLNEPPYPIGEIKLADGTVIPVMVSGYVHGMVDGETRVIINPLCGGFDSSPEAFHCTGIVGQVGARATPANAYAPGDVFMRGIAPKAKMICYNGVHGLGVGTIYSLVFSIISSFRQAIEDGVDVFNNSWITQYVKGYGLGTLRHLEEPNPADYSNTEDYQYALGIFFYSKVIIGSIYMLQRAFDELNRAKVLCLHAAGNSGVDVEHDSTKVTDPTWIPDIYTGQGYWPDLTRSPRTWKMKSLWAQMPKVNVITVSGMAPRDYNPFMNHYDPTEWYFPFSDTPFDPSKYLPTPGIAKGDIFDDYYIQQTETSVYNTCPLRLDELAFDQQLALDIADGLVEEYHEHTVGTKYNLDRPLFLQEPYQGNQHQGTCYGNDVEVAAPTGSFNLAHFEGMNPYPQVKHQYLNMSYCTQPAWLPGFGFHAVATGTSTAVPYACAVAILAIEAYKRTHGRSPQPSMVKNIVLKSADQLVGPKKDMVLQRESEYPLTFLMGWTYCPWTLYTDPATGRKDGVKLHEFESWAAGGGKDKYFGYGRVNAYKAIKEAKAL